MSQDRRQFLATLGSAVLAASCRRAHGTLAPELPPLGLQLYTVREPARTDLALTLRRIAAIGFKEVELEAYYGHTPADFRSILDANGLVAPSGHFTIEQIETEPKTTFDGAHAVGHQWLTLRELPRGKRQTRDDWQRLAKRFNTTGAAVRSSGFHLAFHNHNDIFRPVDGSTPFEILIAETDPALVSFELDTYWATSGGADPVALLQRYAPRIPMIHIKDGRPPFTEPSQADVGAGVMNYAPILAAARGDQHRFVESDSAADPFAFAKNSYDYLRRK
jgi:sugar phosphate isomerase/epimerase